MKGTGKQPKIGLVNVNKMKCITDIIERYIQWTLKFYKNWDIYSRINDIQTDIISK